MTVNLTAPILLFEPDQKRLDPKMLLALYMNPFQTHEPEAAKSTSIHASSRTEIEVSL